MDIRTVYTLDEDYDAGFEIYVDDMLELSFFDGESEDNNIGRNFNDILGIPRLLQRAYEAGKAGEDFNLKEEEE